MAVSSFTSVSLEPPLVAFLPDKSSTSWPKIRGAGAFCVNILSAGQEELCAQFARKGIDKFAGVAWHPAPSGAPVLDGVMAWIDCELTQTFASGDHFIAIGRVLQLEASEYGVPLVFFQGGYGHFALPPRSPAGTAATAFDAGPEWPRTARPRPSGSPLQRRLVRTSWVPGDRHGTWRATCTGTPGPPRAWSTS